MKSYLFKILFLLLPCSFVFGQQEHLVIARTTGELNLLDTTLVTYGFTNTLSGQVTLPGTTIETTVGDTVLIDFWNISQGEPHAIIVDGISLTQNEALVSRANIEPIHHMDHAYYNFIATEPGSYLYYCPFNFPFNVQAGMFGVILVKEGSGGRKKLIEEERIWCSFEIDSTWHRAEIMDIDEARISSVMATYNPQYFLINGQLPSALESPLPELKEDKNLVKIHLVNAGQYHHEIYIPTAILAEDIYSSSGENPIEQKITLPPMTIQHIVLSGSKARGSKVRYDYRSPKTNTIVFTDLITLN